MQDNKIKTNIEFHNSDVKDILSRISNIFQYSDYNTMKEIPESEVRKFDIKKHKKDLRNYRKGEDYKLLLPSKNYIIVGNSKGLHYYTMLFLYFLYRINDGFYIENDCVVFSKLIDCIWSNDSEIRFQYDKLKILFIYISSDYAQINNEKYLPDFVRSRSYPTIILTEDKSKIPSCIKSELFEIIDFKSSGNINNSSHKKNGNGYI